MLNQKKYEYESINWLGSSKFINKTYQIPESLGEVVDGKKIVKSGTVYPSNDENAIGIVFNDVDVTNGDEMASILVAGIILEERLPEEISNEAFQSLKLIDVIGKKVEDNAGGEEDNAGGEEDNAGGGGE